MKRLITLLVLVFSINLCWADTNYVDVSKLSDTQKAELAVQAAKLADQNKHPTAVVDQVDKWVTIGSNIGKGLAGTAKELGVAANEFAQTPVGKVTAGLIIWKVAGHDLVSFAMHVIGGPLFFLVMSCFWFWYFRKTCMSVVVTETYSKDEKDKQVKTVKKETKLLRDRNDDPTGYFVIWILGYIAIIGASIVMTFSY